jgi:HJR/Mrr/RecB family endonuclease
MFHEYVVDEDVLFAVLNERADGRLDRGHLNEQLVEILRTDQELWNHLRYDEFSLEPFSLSLQGADLRGVEIHQAHLDNVDLTDARLSGGRFGTRFNGSILTRADMRNATFHRCSFNSADLSFADLRGSDLRGAVLMAADLTGANLHGARFYKKEENLRGYLEIASARAFVSATFDSDFSVREYVADVEAILDDREAYRQTDASGWRPFDTLPQRRENLARHLEELARSVLFTPPPPSLITVTSLASAKLVEHLTKHPHALHALRPRQFEEVVAELLANHGWRVELTPQIRDGGYDIFAVSQDAAGPETAWIVECKKYAADRKVGVEIVRSLYGVKSALPGVNAMVATTSTFTRGARDFKSSRWDLDLRDYQNLVEWLRKYRANSPET